MLARPVLCGVCIQLSGPANELEQSSQSWTELRWMPVLNGEPPVPRIPWKEITAAVSLWRAAGYFDRFFFMRKPPGLRLRFRTSSADFQRALAEWLSELMQAEALLGCTWSIYEPEQYRFGGPEGMELAHEYWTCDSEVVLRYELLSSSQRGSIPRAGVWAMLVNDLLRRSLGDSSEIWDVWRRLVDAVGQLQGDADTAVERYSSMARALFSIPNEIGLIFPPPMRAIFERMREVNARTATALLETTAKRTVTRGRRSWLAANALFQANRWAIGLEAREFIGVVEAMIRLLEPDHASFATALNRTRDT